MTGDPRSIVTPDAFSVTPDLLGTPLAEPWRRFAALLVDLVLIGFLQLLGWRVLGGVAALILFRLATRRPDGTPSSRVRKATLGCAGALVLVVAVGITTAIPAALRMLVPEDQDTPAAVNPAADSAGSPGDRGRTIAAAFRAVTDVADVVRAEDEEEVLESALGLGRNMIVTGLDREQVSDNIEKLVNDNTSFDGEAIAGRVVEELFGEVAETVAERDPVAEGVTPSAAELALADSLAALQESLDDVRDDLRDSRTELAETRDELAEAESRSTLFTWIRDAADEAGLVFGWGTVYLTLFLALWQGRTPGKKLLGLRVVRLNGQPLGLYMSLERAGGYAAGVATGLLGFAQVWWDPNRQAIHDKITETVVIREGLPNRLQRDPSSGEGVAEAVASGEDTGPGRAATAGKEDFEPDIMEGRQE